MEYLRRTGKLVALGLVDSSVCSMSKGLGFVNAEILIAKDLLCWTVVRHFHQLYI